MAESPRVLDPQAAAIAADVVRQLRVPLLLKPSAAWRHTGLGKRRWYLLRDRPGFPKPVKIANPDHPDRPFRLYRRADLDAWAAALPQDTSRKGTT